MNSEEMIEYARKKVSIGYYRLAHSLGYKYQSQLISAIRRDLRVNTFIKIMNELGWKVICMKDGEIFEVESSEKLEK